MNPELDRSFDGGSPGVERGSVALAHCALTSGFAEPIARIADDRNCENEALVDGEHVGGRWQYVCFACGEAWEGGDLEHCGGCGELYVPDDSAVCDRCLSDMASRDD